MIDKIKALEKVSKLLDPPNSQRANWNEQVLAYTSDFLGQLGSKKAYYPSTENSDGILDYQLKEQPEDLSILLSGLKRHVDEVGINPVSGGHLGYIPGGGLYPSALGDYLAAAFNKYAGIFYPAPGAVRLENMLIRWMANLMGFPAHTAGNLTSGGSISNLIAVVTAREAKGIKAADFHKLVVYLSDQTHHSLQKALKIAGLGEAQLRYLTIDENFRLSSKALEAAIEEDQQNGLIPFLINASLGTTNTGTIDPINEIAEIANSHNIWFHIDAAYGGFFKLLPELDDKLKGVEKADSIILDPHKSLFLPFGSGAVLVKDIKSLYKAHQYTADYFQDLVAGEEVNPADVSPELTKHFRGLRMWLPLKLFGLSPFKAALREKLLLAEYFSQEVQKIPEIAIGPKPDLSVVVFRFVQEEEDRSNTFNKKLIKAIQNDGRIFISSTTIDGIFWMRAAILVFRTHLREVDMLLTIIREKSATMLSK